MSASLGQVITVQITSGRFSVAVVTKIITGDLIDLVALTDTVNPWPTVDTPNGVVVAPYQSIAKGSAVGQWQDLGVSSAVSDAIAAAVSAATAGLPTTASVTAAIAALAATDAAGLATAVTGLNSTIAANASLAAANLATATSSVATLTSLVTALQATVASLSAAVAAIPAEIAAAVAALPPPDLSGRMAVPTSAGAAVTLAMSAARQNTSDRPVLVTACGGWADLVTGTGSVQIFCDSGSTPTTVRAVLPVAIALGLLTLGLTMPWSVCFLCPAGHYYKIAPSTGSVGTFSITSVNEATT